MLQFSTSTAVTARETLSLMARALKMTCAMARMLEDGQTCFHGVSSHMPMVAMALARASHAPHLTQLDIAGGVNPSSCKTDRFSSAGPEIYRTGTAYFPLADVFDLSMRGGLDVAFLSGVQFDSMGNVNASVIGDYHHPKVRLPGGAGSAVLIPTAKRAILWRTKHDRRTMVPQVDFVTTRGNAWRLVTPLCVFAFRNAHWEVDSIHATSSLDEVTRETGFPVICPNIQLTPPPTVDELVLLRRIDPDNLRRMELD